MPEHRRFGAGGADAVGRSTDRSDREGSGRGRGEKQTRGRANRVGKTWGCRRCGRKANKGFPSGIIR
eukprot:940601-Pyramimonas_sp.AAC.1